MLPVLAAVLAITGVAANAPVVVLSWLWSAGPDRRVSSVVAALLAVGAVALDVRYRTGRGLRPPAVHTQVPQWWGQHHGPWWAAVRYGLRLGLGPATILNTWTWWAAMAIAVSCGPLATLLGASTFVGVRTIVMFVATFGPRDGVAMARRAAQLDRHHAWALRGGQLVVLGAAVVVVIGRVRS